MNQPLQESNFMLDSNIFVAPAAGANFVSPGINGLRILLLSVDFDFTTDANVANRYITLSHVKSGYETLLCPNTTAHIASLTNSYHYWPSNRSNVTFGSLARFLIALAPDFYLDPLDSLHITVLNIQAGDTFSDINIRFKAWPL